MPSLVEENWNFPHILAITNTFSMNIYVQVFVGVCFHFSWIEVTLLSDVNSTFSIFRNCQGSDESSYSIVHSHLQCMRFPIASHPCHHLFSSFFFSFKKNIYSSHPNGCAVLSHMDLICIFSLMTNFVQHLFV